VTTYVTATFAGIADEVDVPGDNVEREMLCWGTSFDVAYQGSVRL
jgi:hypothetical protein